MLTNMFAVLLGLLSIHYVKSRPLDDYVAKVDPEYGWKDFGEDYVIEGTNVLKTKSWKGHTLNLTSVRWLTDDEFHESSQTGSVWWHYMVVIVPDTVDYQQNASIYITGGSNGMNSFPDADDEDIAIAAAVAMDTNMVVGCLFQIPNEHVTFTSDPDLVSRTEGAIDAFTWDHYLRNQSDPTWLYYFPMTKASVRAMDAMQEFVAYQYPSKQWTLDWFTVLGASKRGWTTWLVGAVDKRVSAIVPVVMDAIHTYEFMHHQWKAYGGFSFTLEAYLAMNITSRIDTPEFQTWATMDDPYTFFDRLTMPKLIVNAGYDEFMMPDDSFHWFDDLPEPKRLLMTPNADHSMATGLLEIIPAISSFMNLILHKDISKLPSFTWDISESDGSIVATLDDVGEVHEASLWYAYSCGKNPDGINRRDFRLASLDYPCECGLYAAGYCANSEGRWRQEVLVEVINEKGERTYSAHVDAPSDGRYVASFIDVKYNNQIKSLTTTDIPKDLPRRLEFTTQVSVFPNTYPYADCEGEGCAGTLL